jgi:hypothetical protein
MRSSERKHMHHNSMTANSNSLSVGITRYVSAIGVEFYFVIRHLRMCREYDCGIEDQIQYQQMGKPLRVVRVE